MIKQSEHSRIELTENIIIRSVIALTEKIINVDGHVRRLVIFSVSNHA